MDNDKEYVRQLEEVIKKFLQPMKGIPFSICIKALTGFSVIGFDCSIKQNKLMLEDLSKAAQMTGDKAFQDGIYTARPNEAGNQMEPFVLQSLREVGLKAGKPASKSGKIKSAGYPDIQIEDRFGRTIYLDCKTYSAATKNQSFRTFYFSPSADPKITRDAFHLLMSFELSVSDREGKRAFVPVSWQIYTLERLLVQIKHEFNASNKELYRPESLLRTGIISK